MSLSRRTFQAAAAAAAAAAGGLGRLASAAPEIRIRLAFIGLGNRGDQVLDAFLAQPDCDVVALCDLHQPYIEFAAGKVHAARGSTPEGTHDYRTLLERADVDAVVIATPDHWHALQTIHACRAGKDVYVEKPLSRYVAEGRAMVRAAREHNRIVQCGIQRLSSPMAAEAAEVVRSGGIGKVTAVRCFHIQNEWPKGIGRPADSDPPAGFDWDAWCGPAPLRPYNINRTFYRFRWFDDYSGGQLTNFGVHYLAQVHRSLGVDAPLAVAALGGKFADYDNREVPDTLEVVWRYSGDVLVTFSQFNASSAPGAGRPCEIEFRGTQGTLYFNTDGYEVVPEAITPNEFAARTPVDRRKERGWRTGERAMISPRQASGSVGDADHARNFLDCVTSRRTPSCDVEFATRCTTAALLGGIALRTQSLLTWDAATESFPGHDEANRLLTPNYRAPYAL